jgi:hypothetical protein
MGIKDAFIEVLEARLRDVTGQAAALVDAVERYTRQECSRFELLNTAATLKSKLK